MRKSAMLMFGRYAAGWASAEEVIALIDIERTSDRQTSWKDVLDSGQPAVVEGTWDEVSQAYHLGVITDRQYQELYEASR